MDVRKAREEGGVSVEVVTTDLIARARAGDGEAFRELTEPYRRELLVHCYRMLGSFQDAEDVVEGHAAGRLARLRRVRGTRLLRTWCYRIATNRCLNARRSASRRPAKEWDMPKVEPSRAGSARRGRMARAISRRPPRRGGDRRAARPGGPLRARPNPSPWPS
jgi:DNA-directed RNA polymerase specialized sigma24 family protein